MTSPNLGIYGSIAPTSYGSSYGIDNRVPLPAKNVTDSSPWPDQRDQVSDSGGHQRSETRIARLGNRMGGAFTSAAPAAVAGGTVEDKIQLNKKYHAALVGSKVSQMAGLGVAGLSGLWLGIPEFQSTLTLTLQRSLSASALASCNLPPLLFNAAEPVVISSRVALQSPWLQENKVWLGILVGGGALVVLTGGSYAIDFVKQAGLNKRAVRMMRDQIAERGLHAVERTPYARLDSLSRWSWTEGTAAFVLNFVAFYMMSVALNRWVSGSYPVDDALTPYAEPVGYPLPFRGNESISGTGTLAPVQSFQTGPIPIALFGTLLSLGFALFYDAGRRGERRSMLEAANREYDAQIERAYKGPRV